MPKPKEKHSKKKAVSNEGLAEMIDALARTTVRGFEQVDRTSPKWMSDSRRWTSNLQA
jgi:hypothetical protein